MSAIIFEHNYCTRKITKVLYHKHNNVKIRSLKNYNKETFEQMLKDATWSDVYTCGSVEGAWLAFKSKFQTIVDSLAPLKEIRIKQSTAPWITAEIIDTRSERRLENSKVQAMSVGITCICTYEMRFNIRPKPQKPTIMKHKSKKIKTNQLNFGKH